MKINWKSLWTIVVVAAILLVAACSAAPRPAPSGPSLPLPGTQSSTEVKMPDAFLEELRAHGVPMSTTGKPEIQIGTGICQQVANGADPRALARDLTPLGWTAEQATVTVAQRHPC